MRHVNNGDNGNNGRQQEPESGITPMEVEAFAARIESLAGQLKEVTALYASSDDSDRVRAREALLILEHCLAGELAAFSMKGEP